MRRLCLQLPHQHGSQTARLCSPQDYFFFSWDVHSYCTFAATCCYRRLNVIECVDTHASLAFFSRQTNTSSFLHALRAYVLPTVMQPSGLLVLFMGRTFTRLCCNLLLLSNVQSRTPRLLSFRDEPIQHFVGSAHIAGLCCFTYVRKIITSFLECYFFSSLCHSFKLQSYL